LCSFKLRLTSFLRHCLLFYTIFIIDINKSGCLISLMCLFTSKMPRLNSLICLHKAFGLVLLAKRFKNQFAVSWNFHSVTWKDIFSNTLVVWHGATVNKRSSLTPATW
jgi:hypothetical protein